MEACEDLTNAPPQNAEEETGAPPTGIERISIKDQNANHLSASDTESEAGGEKTGDFGKEQRASLIEIEIPAMSIFENYNSQSAAAISGNGGSANPATQVVRVISASVIQEDEDEDDEEESCYSDAQNSNEEEDEEEDEDEEEEDEEGEEEEEHSGNEETSEEEQRECLQHYQIESAGMHQAILALRLRNTLQKELYEISEQSCES